MPRTARIAVPALVTAGVLLATAVPANATPPETARLWSVTRAPDGTMKVVRGLKAAIAATDARLGRTAVRVLTTEEARPVRALGDPRRWEQWALDRVPYEPTWSASRGSGVTVAVVDTGVLAAHEDLAGAVVPGVDLAADAPLVDPWGAGMVDPGGHGTHVAGIVAARANNGRGVAGGAPSARIMPVRVLDAHGSGTSDDVAEGIIWAVDHGARVVNLSLGGGESAGMRAAIQYAVSKNVVVVAAAGNAFQSGNAPLYPAAYPEAIAVAAVNGNLDHASFSNTGSYVDIAAPGDLILSTYGASVTDYQYMNGTSMATPYVAAAAALVVAKNKALSATRVRQILESTATDRGAPGRDDTFGHGVVDPRRAVIAAMPPINGGTKGRGYWVVTVDGQVRPFGEARSYGDLRGRRLTAPIVAAARTPTGRGYWLASADGAVFSFGDARFYGSMYGRHLNGAIVGMAATPSGNGYVLLGRDGGIFTFGDARFYGSMGGKRLNGPVLDMTITANGRGYWFVAADGGIFSFGNARFYGSTGSMRLAAPMRSMTAAADGRGYWMVAADGGIFAFGVPFKGSLPGVRGILGLPYVPTVRMRALPTKDGYYMLGLDGTVYSFGAAKYYGSARGTWAVDLMQLP
jgi:type VII secretion-associated serine protease mycosin